jgi:ubiquinone/menaquinone biosynthesis C-methylase UbiE
MGQCQMPRGRLGRFVLWLMNKRHSPVTDWGLSQLSIAAGEVILDVGCGGGRTIEKLAAAASPGKVHGIDHSADAVAWARRHNRVAAARGQVAIEQASVSQLPFADGTFDLVTAIETHFWWPDLAGDLKEVRRVVKPGGRLAIIAEFYLGKKYAKYVDRLKKATTMALLTSADHRALLVGAGFTEVRIIEDEKRGWICCLGTKPPRTDEARAGA